MLCRATPRRVDCIHPLGHASVQRPCERCAKDPQTYAAGGCNLRWDYADQGNVPGDQSGVVRIVGLRMPDVDEGGDARTPHILELSNLARPSEALCTVAR